MKKWLVLCAACFFSTLFSLPIQERKIDPSALSQLSIFLGIPEESDIVIETQARWLRKMDQEPWEMATLSPTENQFVLNWASCQGLFSPWEPALQTYKTALILGTTTSLMQSRLNYLKRLWDEGIRFHEIVWLTGDRPLDKRVDGLIDRCHNESEAAHLIWEETSLPEEIRSLPVVFMAVPMKKEGLLLKRPNTADTIIAWLAQTPSPSTALFVSSQPFCGYQYAIIKAILPESFLFDVVGPGADSTSHPAAAAITLDSLARWIYQEHLNHQTRSL